MADGIIKEPAQFTAAELERRKYAVLQAAATMVPHLPKLVDRTSVGVGTVQKAAVDLALLLLREIDSRDVL